MSRSKNILPVAILAVSLMAVSSVQAQQTYVNPNPGGPGTGIGQPSKTFYDSQLGVTFTRVNSGVSRPSVRFNPGGGTGGATYTGLRVDRLSCNGMGKRIGLELGDVIIDCSIAYGHGTQFVGGGGGSVTTHLQVVDIRTGRVVNVQVPGASLHLDIQGTAIRPIVGQPGEGNPSRPSFQQRSGGR